MQAPHHWLIGLAASLHRSLAGQELQSCSSGPLWLQLRFTETQLFLFAQADRRLAWLDERGLPKQLWSLLDQHDRSPFRPHLRELRCAAVHLLVDDERRPEGLSLDFGSLRLAVRWHPRPGALWLERADGEALAQLGNMSGEELHAVDAAALDFDLQEHGRRCRETLQTQLAEDVRRRMARERRDREKRARRLEIKLEADLKRAQGDLHLRAAADALAARLHEWRQLPSELELEDFEGNRHRLELDPTLSPARNLDLLYKRCAKAERSVEKIRARIDELESSHAALPALEELELDALLTQAQREDIDLSPGPRSDGARRDAQGEERLPYRRVFLASGLELRIGRSARDNDEMLRHHSNGKDLWLHAQGVQGSHVLIRHGPRAPTPREIEIAAEIAAHQSKARTSSLVPVVFTERRYVRKPRKAPPGTVVAERTRTLFVKPNMPEDELS